MDGEKAFLHAGTFLLSCSLDAQFYSLAHLLFIREGDAFSALVCLDRKCACSASSNDFEVQYLSV